MKRSSIIPALACLLAASPLAAQVETAPETLAGRRALSLDVGGGYVVGLWQQASERVRGGLEVGVQTESNKGEDLEEERIDVFVQPSIKLFSATEGALRPYTMLGVYLSHGKQTIITEVFESESEYSRTEFGARLGLGVEWMPVSRVAVGGHVGVRAGMLERTTPGAGNARSDGWTAGTFSTGVVLTLFL